MPHWIRRLANILLLLGSAAGCDTGRILASTSAVVQAPARPAAAAQSAPTAFPNRQGSLKFAVLGDFGTGDRAQYQLAEQMTKLHQRFPFELVILVGDNLYGGERPRDFQRKFEIPYKPLLDAGVKFYASLGNHDARNQRFYKLFNMDGKLYYSFKAPKQSVRFFALETTYAEPEQMAWIERELDNAKDDWKIPFFHHPLYSSGERHGSDTQLRTRLEPLFVKNDVTVVFTGHDHFYERVKPQQGIAYFVVGSGGKLRDGNIDPTTGLTASGFDRDLAFLAAEIFEDQLTFNTISRTGQTVDSGVITRRQPPR
jgi:diadenosine tetraphosphatase ApaH/serine/threonine PP2A family protein phosphatase